MRYRVGSALNPIGKGHKIIAHVCNDSGKWGAGFVLAISKKWDKPERMYRRWFRNQGVWANDFAIDNVQFVKVESNIKVCNMIAQRGLPSKSNPNPLDHAALASCLWQVARDAELWNASVHMPLIGCGLARGNWADVKKIIKGQLILRGNVKDVVVYLTNDNIKQDLFEHGDRLDCPLCDAPARIDTGTSNATAFPVSVWYNKHCMSWECSECCDK